LDKSGHFFKDAVSPQWKCLVCWGQKFRDQWVHMCLSITASLLANSEINTQIFKFLRQSCIPNLYRKQAKNFSEIL